MPAPKRPCRRCGRLATANRMIQGYGSDCATRLGLTGTTTDVGQDGPDLLDLLAECGNPEGCGTCQNHTLAGTTTP